MSYKGKKPSKIYNAEEGYNLYASSYDGDFSYLNSFEDGRFLKIIRVLRGKKILDAGCGSGRLMREFKHWDMDISACDISPEMIKIMQKKFPEVDSRVADVEHLPFKEGEFDAVFGMFLIVHIGDLTAFFDEAYRVLKDGGSFIVSNINQKKAPKLKVKGEGDVVIKSYYHIPRQVLEALEKSRFTLESEFIIEDKGVWVNQIITAVK